MFAARSIVVGLVFLGALPAVAQQPGFVSLFDGKTLNGWSCPAMQYWSVQDGAITARTTEPITQCFYLVWQGGKPADFELKVKFRIQGPPEANSGIQFRSKVRADGFVEGYQADITREERFCGVLYDETPGRGLLASRGQKTTIDAQGRRTHTQFADPAQLFQKIDRDGWNEYHIIARGPHVMAKINGVLMWEAIDQEPGRHSEAPGVIALQLHAGPPMTVQFKDIWLKTLQ